MALVQITINGTDYAALITDLAVQIREQKKQQKNLKGESNTVPPRSRSTSGQVQFTFPYSTPTMRNTLKALFDAGNPVTLGHGGTLDFKAGTYVPVDYGESKVKSLDQIIYTIIMTFNEDIAANLVTLQPTVRTDLSYLTLTQKFGF